ncbi:amino-acid N-acetyltransferase [Georgenia faecalis]|uniref:Amino-acid N-acetyltransferase n=1 Tax=Georgenia faecalis TaxID=2483799 RepID=A0ABV9D969_9MICO|nr:amino-acid N-acetyltransferase [Georgenia faecalis]
MSSSGGRPDGGDKPRVVVRQALPADARRIRDIVAPNATEGILIDKDLVAYFESIQEFVVAEVPDGDERTVVGCGALHVLWDDIAEVRTLAVDRRFLRRGVGHHVLGTLLERARALGLKRVFSLTFEVEFFGGHGFVPIAGTPVGTDVYAAMLRSHDDGVAEFLDLARVKPNTLGNTRMLLEL